MERKFTGDEHFTYGDISKDFQLSDFWSWFSSDLLNNITRGILAEYQTKDKTSKSDEVLIVNY